MYIYISHIFFNYSPIDGHLRCSLFLAIINKASINTEVHYLFEIVISFALDKYPEVGLLEHVVVLLLIF